MEAELALTFLPRTDNKQKKQMKWCTSLESAVPCIVQHLALHQNNLFTKHSQIQFS